MRKQVSVVVTNYNYARYLRQCIDSCLSQAGAGTEYALEVVVVDDGSTDESRGIIEAYGNAVHRIFKMNGGMVSSFNRGFADCRGDVVIFLDADDYLADGAIRTHLVGLNPVGTVRSQGIMEIVDGEGHLRGDRLPGRPAPGGALRDTILARGPGAVVSVPNSGNAWSRSFLNHAFPLPEPAKGVGAETFLMDAAGLFGDTASTTRTVAFYRIHGSSMSSGVVGFGETAMQRIVSGLELRATTLAAQARKAGHAAQAEAWQATNWRLQTLRHLLFRLGAQGGAAVTLPQHLRSAAHVEGLAKQAAVRAVILAAHLLPTPLAMRVAAQAIRLNYM